MPVRAAITAACPASGMSITTMRRLPDSVAGVVIVTFGNSVAGLAQSPKYFSARANALTGVRSPPMTRIALSGR